MQQKHLFLIIVEDRSLCPGQLKSDVVFRHIWSFYRNMQNTEQAAFK